MKTKHTKGPWRAEQQIGKSGCNVSLAIIGPGGRTVFWMENVTSNDFKNKFAKDEQEIEQLRANARLIASAPELVAALEGLVRRMESEMKRFPIVEQQKRRAYITAARAVLAKAGRGVEGGGE